MDQTGEHTKIYKCKCGCGGAPNIGKIYVHGHNPHKLGWFKKDSEIKKRNAHKRAGLICKRANKIKKCEIKNNTCTGLIEVSHLDQNPFNNDLNNLAYLCRSHHTLYDRSGYSILDLKNKKNILYVNPSGRRFFTRAKNAR